MLTLEIMQKMWVHGDQHIPGLIEGIVASMPAVFAKYPDFTKPIVLAHAMAQFSWECNYGLEMIENMNYSAPGLIKTWPKHFDRTTAPRYAHSPKMIADVVYGGRMGNAPPPSDEGWFYRGRGLSQLTGKGGQKGDAGYTEVAEKTGLDLLDDPDLCLNPAHTLEIAVADFILNGCVEPAEADDVVAVTKHLNGGINGLPGRKAALAKWKPVLLG